MFPSILKGLRKQKGVTQIQLANALGVSPGNVGDWETGKSCPSYQALKGLADFFEVSADVLLGIYKVEGIPVEGKPLEKREPELIAAVRTLDRRDREELFDLAKFKLQRKSS